MNTAIRKEMQCASENSMSLTKKLGAAGGLLFGSISFATGVALSILASFERINFDNTEIILLTSAFALLGLGAHCLDLLEKERKTNRK